MSMSIFIVNYNTCALLEKCLSSVFASRVHLPVEVFVADSNSNDGSQEMVRRRFPQVHLKSLSENVGFTKAVNRLLPMAAGKYYVLLHPDLILLPDTLEQFVEFFEGTPNAGILGANLYYPDGCTNPCEILFPGFKNDLICFGVRFLRKLPGGLRLIGDYNPLEWSHEATLEVNWVWNACMIVRREVFERIGYFDEDFFVWYADWDLCKRARDVGWSIYYLHSAKAIHYESQSFSETGIPIDTVRYKIDGWYSAAGQTRDRCRFLNKHLTAASRFGTKVIALTENTLRLCAIVAKLSLEKTGRQGGIFQLKACLEVLRTILAS